MPSRVTAPTRREHMSFSQMQLAAQCGEAYRRKYIEGHTPGPENLPAMVGSAFHSAVELWEGAMYREVGIRSPKFGWSEQVDFLELMTKKQLNIRLDEYELPVETIITYGNQDLEHWRREKIRGLAETYLDFRRVEVTRGWDWFGEEPSDMLEVTVKGDIGGHPFLGQIDMIYLDSRGRLVIRDLKTGEAKSFHAMQVHQYRVALLRDLGIFADYGQLLYVKRTKPYVQVVAWDLEDQYIDEMARRLRENVEGNTLMVNGPFTGHCTNCDFQNDCPWSDVTPHGSS